jgi:hypothetical protein
LANLKFAQRFDDVRADEERDQKRGERGEGGSKREIAEYAERVEERVELLIEQPVKQRASRAGF